ncbi:MAG TPA: EamA family transporter [Bryobacteraceae bacterium]|nr:EamA family transporter [Bryobacteraceae bacterium]
MTTPLSSIAWVTVASFIGSFGSVGLKAGAHRLEFNLKGLVTNWELGLGIAGYLVSWLFFVQGLRQGDLSVLYPMVSLGYVWTMFWSKLFFGEPLTKGKFFGLGLILVGCGLLGLGTR